MEHNYLDIESKSGIKSLVIHPGDNLNNLPSEPAVYALCGRVNSKPVNPRYIGQTGNLQAEIIRLFDKTESGSNECLKEFLLSIKIKEIVYQTMANSTEVERLGKKDEWEDEYKPDCNKELNEIH